MREKLSYSSLLWFCFTVISLGSITQATAQQPSSVPDISALHDLPSPVGCQLGQNCFLLQYVDHDTSSGATDFQCSTQSYDHHKGTDFALYTQEEMKAGVPVLAIADGVVLRTRDQLDDVSPSAAQKKELIAKNLNCGNGVFINHGLGWTSQYCHLKKGSLLVQSGQSVKKGQQLAFVGQSGMADLFPHLHLTLRYKGAVVDPFTGTYMTDSCMLFQKNMWSPDAEITPTPFNITAAFFSTDTQAIKTYVKQPTHLTEISASPNKTPILLLNLAYTGAKQNDQVSLQIIDPIGTIVVDRTLIQEKNRAYQTYYAGVRNRTALSNGLYTGIVTIRRPSASGPTVSSTRRVTISVN